jgi:hypothetical protein
MTKMTKTKHFAQTGCVLVAYSLMVSAPADSAFAYLKPTC